MIASLLALVLLRLEDEGEAARAESLLLTESLYRRHGRQPSPDRNRRLHGRQAYRPADGRSGRKARSLSHGACQPAAGSRPKSAETSFAMTRPARSRSPSSRAACSVRGRPSRARPGTSAAGGHSAAMTQQVEFSRPVRIDTLGPAPRTLEIEADETEKESACPPLRPACHPLPRRRSRFDRRGETVIAEGGFEPRSPRAASPRPPRSRPISTSRSGSSSGPSRSSREAMMRSSWRIRARRRLLRRRFDRPRRGCGRNPVAQPRPLAASAERRRSAARSRGEKRGGSGGGSIALRGAGRAEG